MNKIWLKVHDWFAGHCLSSGVRNRYSLAKNVLILVRSESVCLTPGCARLGKFSPLNQIILKIYIYLFWWHSALVPDIGSA